MVNNNRTATRAKLHLRECKTCPSFTLGPNYAHQDLTVGKAKGTKSGNAQKLQKLWVSRGHNTG